MNFIIKKKTDIIEDVTGVTKVCDSMVTDAVTEAGAENDTLSPAIMDLYMLYDLNHSLHEPWFSLFSWLYGMLIVVTLVGNSLVVFVVGRNRDMWNARNMLILNLAVSDISK